MRSKKSEFGWSAVFRHYGVWSLFQDGAFPAIVSTGILILMFVYEVDFREQLENLLNIGFMIVPVMISLVLAAYAILLSYILSDSVSKVIENDDGKNFVADLNSGFASYLFFSVLAIVLMIITSCIKNIGIEYEYENAVNAGIYFILCFLLLYSVNVLVGVIIDIFNIGQTKITG